MTPQDALALINRTLRQVNTTADNHDLLREAVGTLAQLVMQSSQDEPEDSPPADDPDGSCQANA